MSGTPYGKRPKGKDLRKPGVKTRVLFRPGRNSLSRCALCGEAVGFNPQAGYLDLVTLTPHKCKRPKGKRGGRPRKPRGAPMSLSVFDRVVPSPPLPAWNWGDML